MRCRCIHEHGKPERHDTKTKIHPVRLQAGERLAPISEVTDSSLGCVRTESGSATAKKFDDGFSSRE
jgi:hypothetical protein